MSKKALVVVHGVLVLGIATFGLLVRHERASEDRTRASELDAPVLDLEEHPRTKPEKREHEVEVEARPKQHDRVDLDKVRAALARLDALQTEITQDMLDREQALMREKAREFAMIEAPEPQRNEVSDEGGRRWMRLTYPSGEVRYEFPPEIAAQTD